MANKSLTDLTARTATADSDLLHINSGGTDYKETKADFLMGTFYREFANTSAVTSQIDVLPAQGTWFGRIVGYGKQTETGLPINANGNLQVRKYNANYVEADFFPVSATADEQYRITKVNGTWGSWSKIPQRSEITSINSNLTKFLRFSFTLPKGGTATYNFKNHLVSGETFVAVFMPRGFVLNNTGAIYIGYCGSSQVFVTQLTYTAYNDFRIEFNSDGTVHNNNTNYDATYDCVIYLLATSR